MNKKTAKRKKVEYVSNEDIENASREIYGYVNSPKRIRKGYSPNKIGKEEINRFN